MKFIYAISFQSMETLEYTCRFVIEAFVVVLVTKAYNFIDGFPEPFLRFAHLLSQTFLYHKKVLMDGNSFINYYV